MCLSFLFLHICLVLLLFYPRCLNLLFWHTIRCCSHHTFLSVSPLPFFSSLCRCQLLNLPALLSNPATGSFLCWKGAHAGLLPAKERCGTRLFGPPSSSSSSLLLLPSLLPPPAPVQMVEAGRPDLTGLLEQAERLSGPGESIPQPWPLDLSFTSARPGFTALTTRPRETKVQLVHVVQMATWFNINKPGMHWAVSQLQWFYFPAQKATRLTHFDGKFDLCWADFVNEAETHQENRIQLFKNFLFTTLVVVKYLNPIYRHLPQTTGWGSELWFR